MHLTDHELTAASSAVAALAIIGGYLGVRSANLNALKIAREERSSRREDELDALKRAIYAKCLSELNALATASLEVEVLRSTPSHAKAVRRYIDAMQAAHTASSELEMVAPVLVRRLTTEAFARAVNNTQANKSAFVLSITKLGLAMRYDARGRAEVPHEILDQMALASMAATEDRYPAT